MVGRRFFVSPRRARPFRSLSKKREILLLNRERIFGILAALGVVAFSVRTPNNSFKINVLQAATLRPVQGILYARRTSLRFSRFANARSSSRARFLRRRDVAVRVRAKCETSRRRVRK